MSLSYTIQRINVYPPFQDILTLANIKGGTIELTDIILGNNTQLSGEVTFISDVASDYVVSNVGYLVGDTINVFSTSGVNKNIFADIIGNQSGENQTQQGNLFSVLEQSPFSINVTFRYETSPGQYAFLLGSNVEYSYFNNVVFSSSNTPDNTYLSLNVAGNILSSNIADDQYIYLTTDKGEVNLPPGRYSNAVAVVRWIAPDTNLQDNGYYSINISYKLSSSPTVYYTTANLNQSIFYNFLIPEQILAGAV